MFITNSNNFYNPSHDKANTDMIIKHCIPFATDDKMLPMRSSPFKQPVPIQNQSAKSTFVSFVRDDLIISVLAVS